MNCPHCTDKACYLVGGSNPLYRCPCCGCEWLARTGEKIEGCHLGPNYAGQCEHVA